MHGARKPDDPIVVTVVWSAATVPGAVMHWIPDGKIS
jgi:hypothetical protein